MLSLSPITGVRPLILLALSVFLTAATTSTYAQVEPELPTAPGSPEAPVASGVPDPADPGAPPSLPPRPLDPRRAALRFEQGTSPEAVDCLYFPLLSAERFPSAGDFMQVWAQLYKYLGSEEFRGHRVALDKTWGESPMFILTSTEVSMAQFKPVCDRARKAGFPEALLEQASLCIALRVANIEGIKDWLPRVRERQIGSYAAANNLFPNKDQSVALTHLATLALDLEGQRKGMLGEIMARPRMLAEADSVFRDLEAIDKACIEMEKDQRKRAGDTATPEEWRAALPAAAPFQRLRKTGLNVLGHSYGPQVIGKRPMVPAETFVYLRDMFGPGQWAPFPDPTQNLETPLTPPGLPDGESVVPDDIWAGASPGSSAGAGTVVIDSSRNSGAAEAPSLAAPRSVPGVRVQPGDTSAAPAPSQNPPPLPGPDEQPPVRSPWPLAEEAAPPAPAPAPADATPSPDAPAAAPREPRPAGRRAGIPEPAVRPLPMDLEPGATDLPPADPTAPVLR